MKKAFWFVSLIVLGCTAGEKPTEADIQAHAADVATWYQERVRSLTAQDGWLNLVGLFWLKEGITTFGSDPGNDVTFPPNVPAKAGYFLVKSGVVTLAPSEGVGITVNGMEIDRPTTVFHPDSTKAIQLLQGSTTRLGSLEWYVIKRDDKLGLRIRDLESEAVKSFRGIDRFPVDLAWKIPATFEPAPAGKTINITNVLGQTTAEPLAGTYRFSLGGTAYTLDATGNGKKLFVVFGDASNGKETYPAGRFIYIDRPDSAGRAFVDFNKAYNPPCAFTEFATCPLPPKENVLPAAILAGEKNFNLHDLKK